MKNKVTAVELSKFMSLKKPNKGLGFFSNGYSGNRESFIKGLEGDMEGCYTGRLIILDRITATNTFEKMSQVMEENCEEMAEVDLENFLAWYDLKNGQVLLVNAEFGGSEDLGNLLVDVSGEEGVYFDEAYLTSKAMEESGIELPSSYKDTLNELKA